jgi:tetratricopeptide (TPR) repeat protein
MSISAGRYLILVMLVTAVAAVLPVLHTAHAESLTETEIGRHLAEAETAFRRAVDLDRSDPEAARDYYRKAILHFERITDEGGIRNGRLYYNIGNAYFRLEDVGRAILNYKRAALFMPADGNLEQNLEQARARRADQIEKKQREKVFKTLFFMHYDIPSRVRLTIFNICFACIWLFAALMLVWRSGTIRLGLVISIVVSALFFSSLVAEGIQLSRRPEGVIVADEIIARKGDAETYQPSFIEPLHAGTEFSLLGRRADWWQIELDNGVRGWIPAHAGELVLP